MRWKAALGGDARAGEDDDILDVSYPLKGIESHILVCDSYFGPHGKRLRRVTAARSHDPASIRTASNPLIIGRDSALAPELGQPQLSG